MGGSWNHVADCVSNVGLFQNEIGKLHTIRAKKESLKKKVSFIVCFALLLETDGFLGVRTLHCYKENGQSWSIVP